MSRILRVILAAAIVLALAWGISALPGRFTLEWGATTLEAATPVAVLGLLILIVVVYAIVRLLAGLWRSPRAIGRARAQRRRKLGDRAVSRTLLAIAAGDGDDARREAGRSRRFLGETPQTLLLEAESSRLADRQQDAETIYRKMAERPDAAFLGYRGLLRLAIERQDWADAAAIARQADAARPGAAWVRRERAMLAIRAGSWGEALELSDQEAPRAALATGAALAESDPAQALRLARTAWKRDPSLAPAPSRMPSGCVRWAGRGAPRWCSGDPGRRNPTRICRCRLGAVRRCHVPAQRRPPADPEAVRSPGEPYAHGAGVSGGGAAR